MWIAADRPWMPRTVGLAFNVILSLGVVLALLVLLGCGQPAAPQQVGPRDGDSVSKAASTTKAPIFESKPAAPPRRLIADAAPEKPSAGPALEVEKSHVPFPDGAFRQRDFAGADLDDARLGGMAGDSQRLARLRELAARGAISKDVLEAAEKEAAGKKPPTKKPDKTPQVWHKDASRPTFARVYVGDRNSLELVSLHVSVTIEGPRARTVVDHVFRNPHDRQLEGTFEYPLPSGASPSYFAMFLGQTRATVPARFAARGTTPPLPADALARLTPQQLVKQVATADWGRLQEAHVVAPDKALQTYEDVVRGRIDPALLEYAGGNTFRGRVFPIPRKGYNRMLIAYEELLPVAGGHMLYRFPLPQTKLAELRFSLQANRAECRAPAFVPKDAVKVESGNRVVFTRTWKDTKPAGEAVFASTPVNLRVQAVSGRQDGTGPHYLYARVRPDLPAAEKATAFASHAVFLLDTSLSEHPDRFAVSMKLLRAILEADPDIRHFNVLTFNVGSAWVEPKGFLPNTPDGRKRAFARLDGLILEGATDLGAALDKVIEPGFAVDKDTPLSCFLLSDGHLTWGETDAATVAARFERRCQRPVRFHCYRTGLGEESGELFEALTRRGGGVFPCYGAADVKAVADAHRRHCLKVEKVSLVGGPEASDLLVAGRRAAVYPGGELVVTAKLATAGATKVVVEGTYRGRKLVQEFPVEVRDGGELAPRGWGEVAVASLLALSDSRLEPLATAYCQQFGIASRVASFLVLENEADFKRLNLEEERGKTVSGDLGTFVADAWLLLSKPATARQAFERLLGRIEARAKLSASPDAGRVKKLLALLAEGDFELPATGVRGALLHKADVPTEYLAARDRDRRAVESYLAEARRRAGAGDTDGAVRVLSSVIEEHPARGDALRLVGYRLLDLRQPAQAARLFQQVQRQRPFEAHSYRDLARSLEECGKYGMAALQYEIVLAGTWHARFGNALKLVAREEYARLMQEAIRRKKLPKAVSNYFGERLEALPVPNPRSDLRVTISWNTDATDVDLWVLEPDGTKVFYSNPNSAAGGHLSQDQTQGYGPERYHIDRAKPGTYTVLVHYYSTNPNLLGGETHVSVSVARKAGSPQGVVQRHTVILKRHDQQVEVCKVKF